MPRAARPPDAPTCVNVLFFDDSTRFITETIDWPIWFALGSIAAGEPSE